MSAEMSDHKSINDSATSKMLMQLFDHWQLNTRQRAALLGLSPVKHRMLTRYRRGTPIESNRDQLERVGHLLAIHSNLGLLFPQNRELAYRRITTRNKAFENLQPVEAIHEWGFAGMLMVRSYLDRAVGGAEFTTTNNGDESDEKPPSASRRRAYWTHELPDDLREAISASVAPPWTVAFNHEVKS